MADFLLFLVILASVINGYRRGALIDVIQFIIWLPIFVFSIFSALGRITSNGFGGSSLELSQSIALIATLSYLMLWFINRFILMKVMHNSRLQAVHLLGTATGFCRAMFVIVALWLCYDIYAPDKELPANIKNSYIVQYAGKLGLASKKYAQEKGWLEKEIKMIYDYTKHQPR